MEYIFICKECNKQFSIVTAIGTIAASQISCPDCKSFDIKRKWFPTFVRFKGKGFTKGSSESEE